jgi:hypothetical protein
LPIKTLVRSFMVIKFKIFFQGLTQLLNGFKFVYINFFILHTAPQPFDELCRFRHNSSYAEILEMPKFQPNSCKSKRNIQKLRHNIFLTLIIL